MTLLWSQVSDDYVVILDGFVIFQRKRRGRVQWDGLFGYHNCHFGFPLIQIQNNQSAVCMCCWEIEQSQLLCMYIFVYKQYLNERCTFCSSLLFVTYHIIANSMISFFPFLKSFFFLMVLLSYDKIKLKSIWNICIAYDIKHYYRVMKSTICEAYWNYLQTSTCRVISVKKINKWFIM